MSIADHLEELERATISLKKKWSGMYLEDLIEDVKRLRSKVPAPGTSERSAWLLELSSIDLYNVEAELEEDYEYSTRALVDQLGSIGDPVLLELHAAVRNELGPGTAERVERARKIHSKLKDAIELANSILTRRDLPLVETLLRHLDAWKLSAPAELNVETVTPWLAEIDSFDYDDWAKKIYALECTPPDDWADRAVGTLRADLALALDDSWVRWEENKRREPRSAAEVSVTSTSVSEIRKPRGASRATSTIIVDL